MATPPKKKTSNGETSKRPQGAKGPESPVATSTAPARAAGPGGSSGAKPRLTGPQLEQAIARRAYEIYEAEGRPEGRQAEHWKRAEAEIRREHSAGA